MLKTPGHTSFSLPSQEFLQLGHLWRNDELGYLQNVVVQREKLYLRYIKRDGLPYAVVPEHLILTERQVTRQGFTLVRNDLFKRDRLEFEGDGKWVSEFPHETVKRYEDKNAGKIWGKDCDNNIIRGAWVKVLKVAM